MRSAHSENQLAPVRVAYIGLHPHTPLSIAKPGVQVIGMTEPDVLYRVTLNPGDLSFQLLMAAHGSWAGRLFESALYIVWRALRGCSSRPYKRYAGMLSFAVRNRIPWMGTDTARIRKFLLSDPPDLLLINSWSILPPEITAIARKGAINIHPSRLPQYVGALPTLWALKNHDRTSAVTFLLLSDSVDGGEVLAQFELTIEEDDDALAIERKVDQLITEHAHGVLTGYMEGTLVSSPQSGEASVTDKYGAYRRIRWDTESAREIRNKVTLYPYLEPYLYSYFVWNGHKMVLRDCRLESISLRAGEYRVHSGRLCVGTKEGVVSAGLFVDLAFIPSLRMLFHPSGLLV